MRIARMVATAINGSLILIVALTLVATIAQANASAALTSLVIGVVPVVTLAALLRRHARGLIRTAIALNAIGLALLAIGWYTPLTDPSVAYPLVVGVALWFTATLVLNLVVLVRSRSAAVAPASPGVVPKPT